MNAFLLPRTAFGFEYLISFRAEHSDAQISRESEIDPKIKRMSSRRFKGGEISAHGFSNFPRTGRISGPEVGDGAKPDLAKTNRQNGKKQEILKHFQATTVTNRFNIILLSLPHWIQHTSIRDENRDIGKSGKPLTKTGRGLLPLCNVANLIHSSK